MKISKQLLKEIIREEYNMLLLEGTIADFQKEIEALNAAVKGKYKQMNPDDYLSVKKTYRLSREIIDFALDSIRRVYKPEEQETDREYLNKKISDMSAEGSFNKLLKEALENLMLYAEKTISGENDQDWVKAGNAASQKLNQATRNLGDIKSYRARRDIYTSDTAAFDQPALAGRTRAMEEKKKPSAGLTKKQKSNVVKKAKAGKDIGKKGKSFDKVARKAGGGEKGRKIAAAAMWKNIKR
jgi:hypothetical protein